VEYNAWHQLDHRPENLILGGVLAGERWVRTPACAALYPVEDEVLASTQYVNSYWFRAPLSESFASWQGLAELSFQQGRRPDVRIATRPMMGMFLPVNGFAAQRVKVSPVALLHRPARGVVLSMHRLAEPRAVRTGQWLAEQEAALRDRLAVPGVAGAWSLSSRSTTIDPSFRGESGSMTFDPSTSTSSTGAHRVELTFLDEDPFAVVETLPTLRPDRVKAELELAEEVFVSLLLPITPWQWDWFGPEGYGQGATGERLAP
jgi:hypothetical protein